MGVTGLTGLNAYLGIGMHQSTQSKNYLLVAAMPTPNGALHLGHVGAQYLPLDVFRRYREQQGHRVVYYGGFDVFDNAVCVAAQREGRTYEEHAELITKQISAELQYLEIHIDGLINHADPVCSTLARKLVSELRVRYGPQIIPRAVRFPFSSAGRPLSGNWLHGQCAYCQATVKGYSCDMCGRSLLPSELVGAVAVDGSAIQWREVELEFVTVPAIGLPTYIRSLPSARPYVPLVSARLDLPQLDLQWTNVDTWGLSLSNEVVFYNRNFTLLEQLLLGDLASTQLGLNGNAFGPDSEVISILAYGKDNVGLLLADIPALAMATNFYRPYRYQWISPFYNVDGRKMSTSGNYAIWVRDVAALPADAIRLHLCRKFDLLNDVDLSIHGLTREATTYGELVDLVRVSLVEAPRATTPASHEAETVLLSLRHALQGAMQDGTADIAIFPKVIDDWVVQRQLTSSEHWLRGLLELAAPVLPILAREIDEWLRGAR
jgi:methionyl-tRNA synthetase